MRGLEGAVRPGIQPIRGKLVHYGLHLAVAPLEIQDYFRRKFTGRDMS
jgi:hypothetical protein